MAATIELFYSNRWNDHTDDVRVASRVQILRGRTSGTQRVRPSELRLAFNNHDATYSPRNPESALYGLIGRNTPIRVAVKLAHDTFSRTVANGWGTPDTGTAWITVGGSAANFNVGSGVGTIALTDTNSRNVVSSEHAVDVEQVVFFTVPATATGDSYFGGLIARWQDSSNMFYAEAAADTTGNIDVTIRRTSGGVDATVASASNVATYSAGNRIGLRFEVVGTTLRARAWNATTGSEPTTWTASGTNTTFTDGEYGVRADRFTSNTNVGLVLSFDDYTARVFRFAGEVESWPVRSQGSGKDVWAPIVAYGITRRLGNGGSEQLAQSALRRFMAGESPDGYWPLEDGPNADGLRSVDGSDPDMTISRSGVTVAADAGPLATWLPPGVRLPNFTAIRGQVGGTSSSEWHVDALYRIDAPRGDTTVITIEGFQAPALGTAVICLRLWGDNTSDGSVAEICWPDLNTSQGSTAIDLGPMTGNTLHHVRLTATQSGGNIVATGYVDGAQVCQETFAGTLFRLDRAGVFTLNEDGVPDSTSFNANQPVTVGHMTAYGSSEAVLADVVAAAFGHQGEQAHERIERLCGEEGIDVTVIGDTSETLGPQGVLPPLELMHEAADADGGILGEQRDELGLTYRTHASLYNQDSTDLDYAQGEVWRLEPSEDTDHVANVVTVHRRDGGESTVERDDGTLGTDTVGAYPVRVELSLETDGQTLQQAAWRSHLGTWDEPRYPAIGVNFGGLRNSGQTTLANALTVVDVGSHLAVDNPPGWAGPDSISAVVDGYFEEAGSHTWTVEYAGSPARSYAVGVLGTNRLGEGGTGGVGSITGEDLDTTETGVTLGTSNTVFSSAAVPYDIEIGGERMTVTAVSGTPQTLTVTRSVNGVVKTHSTGAAVRIDTPLRLSR